MSYQLKAASPCLCGETSSARASARGGLVRGEHAVERGADDLQPVLARGEAPQLPFGVEEVVGGDEALIVAEGVAQAVLVVHGAGLRDVVVGDRIAHGLRVCVGLVARHVYGDDAQPVGRALV